MKTAAAKGGYHEVSEVGSNMYRCTVLYYCTAVYLSSLTTRRRNIICSAVPLTSSNRVPCCVRKYTFVNQLIDRGPR